MNFIPCGGTLKITSEKQLYLDHRVESRQETVDVLHIIFSP